MSATIDDTLARICADTRAETARRNVATPLDGMRRLALAAERPRGFAAALMEAASVGGIGLIAEIKKASPSGGLIRPDFDPAAIANAYAGAGATCLSVLTDGPWFSGSADDLRAARTAVALPVLRKDFVLDAWQVYESRAIGADCILLIMAALSDEEARTLEGVALDLGMDVLAEVHNREELERALALRTPLIGLNNRNLKTLRTDLSTTVELAPLVPPDRLLIAESGIRDRADVSRLVESGATCFLVGESLLRHEDVGAATRALLGTA